MANYININSSNFSDKIIYTNIFKEYKDFYIVLKTQTKIITNYININNNKFRDRIIYISIFKEYKDLYIILRI